MPSLSSGGPHGEMIGTLPVLPGSVEEEAVAMVIMEA